MPPCLKTWETHNKSGKSPLHIRLQCHSRLDVISTLGTGKSVRGRNPLAMKDFIIINKERVKPSVLNYDGVRYIWSVAKASHAFQPSRASFPMAFFDPKVNTAPYWC